MNKIELKGIKTETLAGYLMALGAFRLFAGQKDKNSACVWENDSFFIHSKLDKNELAEFFVEEYEPTPIVTPWNKGSNFWAKNKIPHKNLEVFRGFENSRYDKFHDVIIEVENLIEIGGYSLEKTEEIFKEDMNCFKLELKNSLSDDACEWLDAAYVMDSERIFYPPLFGSGGNDGRLDFAVNFMDWLIWLERNKDKSRSSVKSCLFGMPHICLAKGTLGQFSAGGGGLNNGNEAKSAPFVNPWEFILAVEGALMLAGSLNRVHGTSFGSLSFPFMTYPTDAGTGVTSLMDDKETVKEKEFWAPLWDRPASLAELKSVMSDGRAMTNGKKAEDGFDFINSVKQMGINRGIVCFKRFGLLYRNGQAHVSSLLGTVSVTSTEVSGANLVSGLTKQRWVKKIRRLGNEKETPRKIRELSQKLSDGFIDLMDSGSVENTQNALETIGEVWFEISKRPKIREKMDRDLPFFLHKNWIEKADDGSDEFRIACALAGMNSIAGSFKMRFLNHLTPFEFERNFGRWTNNEKDVVWSGGNLIADMISVLDRRLMQNSRHNFTDDRNFPELPLVGKTAADLNSVLNFVNGDLDYGKINRLVMGIAWAKFDDYIPNRIGKDDDVAVPLAYSLLKPVFMPNFRIIADMLPDMDFKRPDPRVIVQLLRAKHVDKAINIAQQAMRNIGLPVPYFNCGAVAGVDADKILASLLIPISRNAYRMLVKRFYFE